MQQISFLDYQPTPEEMQEPLPLPPRVNVQLLNWLNAKVFYYQHLKSRFLERGIAEKRSGNPNPILQSMRRYEIQRLEGLIQQTLIAIEELNHAK